jgi:N6-adenosine-specific RNA methylase IME4
MITHAWEGLDPPYGTIVADPPWSYNAGVKELRSGGRGGQAEHQYSTMSNTEIAQLPVAGLAAKEAHLYLWVTVPRLFGERNGSREIGPVEIVEAWGFEFKTMLTWVKPGGGGMGWYFRGQTEHVIFATRGGLGIPADKREPNVFTAARGGHSEKPAAFGDLVERVSPGPYIELFCRQPRFGWDSWGHGYELPLLSAEAGDTDG